MEKIEILRIESLSREPLVIEGYLFKGTNPKASKVAIIGAMGGDSILPLYCASTLVDFFNNKIKKEKIKGDIFIIPSINHYALNIGKRYWPLDNTDINMMFPGYEGGRNDTKNCKKSF
ncbi:succinylglutamate desuccinylase/aspartoacylase family protein [Aliarcobacter butzleri]|uniref:succinylglutamate desuccinylase/aspartoacylase domain-containing protein n=1 Tax=Aliarcobacter butzleri TaxID=28197 RepID=UPI001EDCB5ED|nr:succinylglutamate desuccinylase/aspartoacylase family protein [Aliarcobacter butzleri]MCG3674613.1 succinylglutamate desuccinylase/aspartoacylase family protein [Aliarcobacter butzleri]